jgi:hypothetical protein
MSQSLWFATIVAALITLRCERGKVIREEITLPLGFHGWVEIIQDADECPGADLSQDRISLQANDRGIICIREELPALVWYKRRYRFADGSDVPATYIHDETGAGSATYRHWIKHFSLFCVGLGEPCKDVPPPDRLPPGPGWHDIDHDVRRPIQFSHTSTNG